MIKLVPKIIHEDSDILVIDKPSGLVVNRAETVRDGWTVMDWIVQTGTVPVRDGPELSEFEMRQGIIHRLDKDTSGVMVIGKTKEAFENIQEQFKERVVKKEYIALIHCIGGSSHLWDRPQKFIIDAPIGRNPRNRMKWAVVEGGREAVTEFEVIQTGTVPVRDGPELLCALVRCYPRSGRTHQIRVHLTAVNCPVVCDKLYLGRKQYREDIKWCPRIFLHAEKIGFTHPSTKKWEEFDCDLPFELEVIISKFKSQSSKPYLKSQN